MFVVCVDVDVAVVGVMLSHLRVTSPFFIPRSFLISLLLLTSLLSKLPRTPYHHTFETSKARIQAAAPGFTVDAVVNGEISKVSLSDYKGG